MGKLFYAALDYSNPFASLFALMMEAVRTPEMSVYFIVTARRYIPEDSKLQ
jgi:hypothetical protein